MPTLRPPLRPPARRCLLLCFLVMATLYLMIMIWSFRHVMTPLSIQDPSFPGITFNHSGSDARLVMILLVSIPRTPETVCSTIQSIQDHFVDPHWQPRILVHRYGSWPCHHTVSLREFPSHDRVSNVQQSLDYLQLVNEAIDNTISGKDLFEYVLFLDDDVTLCPRFPEILSLIDQVAPHFALAHLGRGGSGIWIHASHLPNLRDRIQMEQQSFQKRRPKNVDKLFLEWGLNTGCTIRPNTIHMEHIGFQSRLHPGQTWKDIDRCGQPANNKAWQSLSETQFHPALFSEYCVHSRNCSQHSAMRDCQCGTGMGGKRHCGILSSNGSFQNYIRRTRIAPLVVLLSYANDTGNHHRLLEDQVLADAHAHSLINLYVIGNYSRRIWLSDNVYASPSDAQYAFKVELKNSSRFGELAFPVELLLLNQLLTPQELWTLKYYEVQHTGSVA